MRWMFFFMGKQLPWTQGTGNYGATKYLNYFSAIHGIIFR